MSSLLQTYEDLLLKTRVKYKKRRKKLGYTQRDLATWSGVSLGSLKRFEQTGKIAYESLLKLSVFLECIDDFDLVCEDRSEV